ncbi:hypothetical protein KR009_009818 [Drosophila setifemur]|nr:hypothetical protein KR009_009818 [Drosophila setifemur]
MYFKDPTFRANKQTEFFGLSDFLSAVGGLMGLFLGFSFLSIAECFYFALIRTCRTCSELRQLQKEPQVMIPPKIGLPGNIKYVSPANWFQAEMAHQQLQRLHFNPAQT